MELNLKIHCLNFKDNFKVISKRLFGVILFIFTEKLSQQRHGIKIIKGNYSNRIQNSQKQRRKDEKFT